MLKAIRLEGSSMLPLFRAGEIVLVEPLLFPDPQALIPQPFPAAGDCVVYNYEGRSLLHRIISANASGALVADDAGRLAPHRVPWSEVSGRVISGNPLKKGLAGLAYNSVRKLFRVGQ